MRAIRRVIRDNAIDPLQNTQQITSSLNYSKRLSWATLTLGGNRRQSLTDGSVQQLLPAVTLSPVPIAMGSDITWSPGLSFTNNTTKNPWPTRCCARCPGAVRHDAARCDAARHGAEFRHAPPVRRLQLAELAPGEPTSRTAGAGLDQLQCPDDPSTPDPTDCVTVRRHLPERLREHPRLGHRHQPAGALPRLLEVSALGRHGQRDERERSPSGTGTPTELCPPGQAVPLRRHGVADAVRLLSRHRAAEPDPPQLLAGHRVELPAGGQRAGRVCPGDRPAGPGHRASERRAAAGHGQPLAGIRGEVPVPEPATRLRPKARRRARSGSSASTPAG